MTVHSLYQACKSIKQGVSKAFSMNEESYRAYLARLSRKDMEARERRALSSPNLIDKALDYLLTC